MYKYVRLVLTLALFSIVAHPAMTLAGDAPPPPPLDTIVVSGNDDETFEVTFFLHDPTDLNGNQPRVLAPDPCHVTFDITGTVDFGDPKAPRISHFVDLSAGQAQVAEFDFSAFAEDDRSQVILTVSDLVFRGSCHLLSATSWFETSTGVTRADPLTFERPIPPDVIDRR